MRFNRKGLAVMLATSAVGVAVPAGSASAAPVVTGGLVNVTITDVLSQNQVIAQVPIGVAATVCDVNAAVLAAQRKTGGAECTATSDQDTSALPGPFRPIG